MIRVESRGKEVYIYVKDELTRTKSTTIVDKSEFEICVEKHKGFGVSDPVKSTMFNYVILGRCTIPITTYDKIKRFLDGIWRRRRDG